MTYLITIKNFCYELTMEMNIFWNFRNDLSQMILTGIVMN